MYQFLIYVMLIQFRKETMLYLKISECETEIPLGRSIASRFSARIRSTPRFATAQ